MPSLYLFNFFDIFGLIFLDFFIKFDIMVWVIHMISLHNATITDIQKPFIVSSPKGKKHNVIQRRYFAISLCMSGRITYTMNEKKYISDPNHVVILPKGGTYMLFGEEDGLFPVVNFESDNLDLHEIAVFPIYNPKSALKKFENLNSLFLYNKSNFQKFSQFYSLLNNLFPEEPTNNPLIRPVLQYIQDHIDNPELSNVELAKQVSISEVYLRKLFSTHLNMTPKQYILDLRIRKAQQLLVDTEYTVTTISEMCGFSSLYHFCRAFHNKTGMTPTEYAHTHKIHLI